MPFILGLLAVAGVAYFWIMRARNAADMAGDLMDVANDVRLAARRFGFRGQANVHPVESITDPNLAAGAIVIAFQSLDGIPTNEDRSAFLVQMQKICQISLQEAEEINTLGQWLVQQCNGPSPALSRISRKLYKLEGENAYKPLMTIIDGVLAARPNGAGPNQRDALQDIRVAMRVR